MKSQRGNIIVYALVGLVLFGILLGSIWWIRQRSTPAPVATDNQTQQQTDTEVKQDETPANPAAETPAAQGDQQQTQTGNNQPQRGGGAATPATPESQTPRTGPSAVAASGPLENTLISSLVLGAATFAGTSYARSRR